MMSDSGLFLGFLHALPHRILFPTRLFWALDSLVCDQTKTGDRHDCFLLCLRGKDEIGNVWKQYSVRSKIRDLRANMARVCPCEDRTALANQRSKEIITHALSRSFSRF